MARGLASYSRAGPMNMKGGVKDTIVLKSFRSNARIPWSLSYQGRKSTQFDLTGITDPSAVTTEAPPQRIFRNKTVLPMDKVKLINAFMSCKFDNYTDDYSAPSSRYFVFKLPKPGYDMTVF